MLQSNETTPATEAAIALASRSPLHSVMHHVAGHCPQSARIIVSNDLAGVGHESGSALMTTIPGPIKTIGLHEALGCGSQFDPATPLLALAGPFQPPALADLLDRSAASSADYISLHGQTFADPRPPLDLGDWVDHAHAAPDLAVACQFLHEHHEYELIHYSNSRQPLMLFQRRPGKYGDIRITPSDQKYLFERDRFDHIDDIDELYRLYCMQTNMDIHVHLPMLRELASDCCHVTEFGTRHGISCSAFMAGRPARLVAFDLVRQPAIDLLERLASKAGTDFRFREENILKADIEATELLFIDSTHTYEHLTVELERFARHCRRYLVFHDTHLFGQTGMYRADPTVDDGIDIPNSPDQQSPRERILTEGLLKAIGEFLNQNIDYRLVCHSQLNNGLVVLKKIN
ncbi:MAG: hypothetical protein ABR550_04100 [Wenzhouxiangellaceae bacterium]